MTYSLPSRQPPQPLQCDFRNADACPLASSAVDASPARPRIARTFGGKAVPAARRHGPTRCCLHHSGPLCGCSRCETIHEVTKASISARTNSLSGGGSDPRMVAPMLLCEFPLRPNSRQSDGKSPAAKWHRRLVNHVSAFCSGRYGAAR